MPTMQPHVAACYKRRVLCSMQLGESRYSGVVLNLSRTGLFIQTSASPGPGEPIRLELRGQIPLRAQVVWRRKVAAHLRSIAEGGIGVQISSAPEEYFQLLAAAAGKQAIGEARGDHQRPSPAQEPAEPVGRKFRARLKRRDSPRSRTIELVAGSAEEAERKALAQVGSGWTLLNIEPRP